jgi:hypothetical protein
VGRACLKQEPTERLLPLWTAAGIPLIVRGMVHRLASVFRPPDQAADVARWSASDAQLHRVERLSKALAAAPTAAPTKEPGRNNFPFLLGNRECRFV